MHISKERKQRLCNPYLPLWEHIPDGEPRLFEDPEHPGKYRVYIYGSHDIYVNKYCGDNLVCWSAPEDDLSDWRYEGVIFEYEVNGKKDTLYAPDVVEKIEEGVKVYYLYPNDIEVGRKSLIAKSESPTGPFKVCNLKEGTDKEAYGVLGYDPGVLVDDDGRVYGYWGFKHSYGAELDPLTMCTPKEGTEIQTMITSEEEHPEDIFRFFEASSIRKVMNKYVFIYSRMSRTEETGISKNAGTLAYAYSDHPLGPWVYGGVIVDNGGEIMKDAAGRRYYTHPTHNTHGSIIEIKGQWYIFYHRRTGINVESRQGMAEPIEVQLIGDRLFISQAEVTSQGLAMEGLDPFTEYSAGIACHLTTGSNNRIPYVKEVYGDVTADLLLQGNPVTQIQDGSIIGYKYFNFAKSYKAEELQLVLNMTARGKIGIDVMLERPDVKQGGKKVGSFALNLTDDSQTECMEVSTNIYVQEEGKHALYLVFHCSEEASCELHSLVFKERQEEQ